MKNLSVSGGALTKHVSYLFSNEAGCFGRTFETLLSKIYIFLYIL